MTGDEEEEDRLRSVELPLLKSSEANQRRAGQSSRNSSDHAYALTSAIRLKWGRQKPKLRWLTAMLPSQEIP